jgi:hypothetical protein
VDKLVRIEDFSSDEVQVWSLWQSGAACSVFEEAIRLMDDEAQLRLLANPHAQRLGKNDLDSFCAELKADFGSLIDRIYDAVFRYQSLSGLTKSLHEGKAKDRSDKHESLRTIQGKYWRVYGIAYGNIVLVIGGLSIKTTKTYQEDPILLQLVNRLTYYNSILNDLGITSNDYGGPANEIELR